MSAVSGWNMGLRVIGLIVLTLLLVACTRERPTPVSLPLIEDTSATGATEGAVPSGVTVPTDAPASGSQPTGTGSQALPGMEDPLGLDDDDGEPTVTIAEGTPTPDGPETFNYTVRPGDTLTGLALRFGTEIAALRNLNALDSDVLAVGQPLAIPYIEGMTAEGAPTPTPGPFYHTVQAGETLTGIAARYGADAIRLVEANSILDPNNLIVGAQIFIPGYEPPTATGGTTAGSDSDPGTGDETRFVHIVQPGEGLLEIAARYNMDANAIANANNLVNRNILRVGQELVIPGLTARDAAIRSGAVHIVQAGESLLGIALRYGVSVEEIMTFNEITNADSISAGQQLIIPRN